MFLVTFKGKTLLKEEEDNYDAFCFFLGVFFYCFIISQDCFCFFLYRI